MKFSSQAEPVKDYNKALDNADSLHALRLALVPFAQIAADACELVAEWSDADFADWRKALKSERRGRFMGEAAAERFAAILMPETMFKVSIVAGQFHVPWGLAFNRLKDVGRLVEENGHYRVLASPAAQEQK